MRNRRTNQKGFTLIELLIVIAIIGILAAVLIPNLLGARKRAYDTGAESCAKSIQTAEAIYSIDNPTVGFTGDHTKLSDLNTACDDANVVITDAASDSSGQTYSFKVGDTRGSKTYTVTATALTASDGAPTK